MFLKLGSTAFGGPAAHAGFMEDEVVHRRAWVSRAEFLDLMAAANLIPGPNSTELAIHIGYRRAGWPGLIVAGTCFILPAALIVSALAWAYVQYGTLPAATRVLAAITPVIIAIVAQALWRLGRTAVKSGALAAIGGLAVGALALGAHELLVLLAAGLAGLSARGKAGPAAGAAAPAVLPLWSWPIPAAGAGALAAAEAGLWPLFLFFAKVGSVLYGSGYVLLAFIRADLVERWGWLTERQLIDAIAVGQITPGPLFTTATFVGYLRAGAAGAVVATVGIFLPAFVFVALSAPLVPRMRRSRALAAFLDGLSVGSLALMAVVTWELAVGAINGWGSALLAGAGAVVLLKWKVNSTWLVLAGAVVGLMWVR